MVALSSLALEEGNLPPAIAEYIEGVGTAGNSLLWIISQILEHSKYSDEVMARPLPIEREAFSLQALLSDLLSMCAPPHLSPPSRPQPQQRRPHPRRAVGPLARSIGSKAASAGVEVIVDTAGVPPDDDRQFIGDTNRVRQSLVNIMDNAIRHSAAPGGREARGRPGGPAGWAAEAEGLQRAADRPPI